MKKIVALLLALVLVIGLAACGTPTNTTPAPAPAPDNSNAGGNEAPANQGGNDAPAVELGFPKEVTIYIPQQENNMLDRSGRIMAAYWREKFPNTKFEILNADGNGNDHATIVAKAQDANDLSVIMFHGAGAIVQYYSGDWDYNLADTSLFKSVAANVGQEQPSGAVTLINANETRFDSIPTLVQYIKDHPGEVKISYTTGTPHEVRIKLILNYFGVKSEDVQWYPSSANDIRAWIQGGNTDVAIITETQAAQDVQGGKVKGICNSVYNRDLYTSDLEPLRDIPIIPEIEGVKPEDAESLVCAWPMTIYVPASVPDELCIWLHDFIQTIRDDAGYMEQIKALGSTNTVQDFSFEEINQIQQDADAQIREVFEAFEGWTPNK